jgi:hypothetical protein
VAIIGVWIRIGIWIRIEFSIRTTTRTSKWNTTRLVFRIENRVGQVTQGSGYIIVIRIGVWIGIRIDNTVGIMIGIMIRIRIGIMVGIMILATSQRHKLTNTAICDPFWEVPGSSPPEPSWGSCSTSRKDVYKKGGLAKHTNAEQQDHQ